MIQFVSLEKGKVRKNRSRSCLMRWKNSSEDFRDTEIVALIQISMRQILPLTGVRVERSA